jgi:hypothetical protein
LLETHVARDSDTQLGGSFPNRRGWTQHLLCDLSAAQSQLGQSSKLVVVIL